MANNKKIKGLTVEIGGDTTKLGKALDDSKPDTTAADPGGSLTFDQLDNLSSENEKTTHNTPP